MGGAAPLFDLHEEVRLPALDQRDHGFYGLSSCRDQYHAAAPAVETQPPLRAGQSDLLKLAAMGTVVYSPPSQAT